MSRIGKKPILIPQGVEVKIDGSKVIVKGPKGETSKEFRPEIKIEIKDDKISISPQQEKLETPVVEASLHYGAGKKLVDRAKKIDFLLPPPSFCAAKTKVKKKTKFSSPSLLLGRETKKIKSFWGLTRMLIANMIEGVVTGFEKKLEIEGIGFKAEVSGEELVLYVGFSHPVKLKIPQEIKILVDKNILIVSGINKELVGQFASVIRKVKPAEPYKGKGIKYMGEIIRRKVGKKVVTAK